MQRAPRDEKMNFSSGSTVWLEFVGQKNKKRKLYSQKLKDLWTVPSEYLVQYWLVHGCEKAAWSQGKNHPKGLE